MRSRQDVIDDLRDLIDGEDDELAVLLGEAIELIEASIRASEILDGQAN